MDLLKAGSLKLCLAGGHYVREEEWCADPNMLSLPTIGDLNRGLNHWFTPPPALPFFCDEQHTLL